MKNTHRDKNNILIIQWLIKHYRKPFYEQLDKDLSYLGFNLNVAYGKPTASESKKKDNVNLDPLYSEVISSIWLFKEKVLFQNAIKQIYNADFIIVEHANKHLINYFLLALNFLKIKKVSFWGHGKNFQSEGKYFSDLLLKITARLPSWWFAYTEATVDHLKLLSYSEKKITLVENSIDVLGFKEYLGKIDNRTQEECLEKISAQPSDIIGLFCGSYYSHKNLPFIFSSLELIKKDIPNFKFVFIGSGPDNHLVEDFCSKSNYAFNLGFLNEQKKIPWFSISKIMINPGLVGLSIIDSFAAGIPIITTTSKIHSPEISYLQHNYNGLILENDFELYSKQVIMLLQDQPRLDNLRNNSKMSAERLTIQNMSKNFSQGILAWSGKGKILE